MELFIFTRFHAGEGEADALAAAIRDVLGPTCGEPGCLAVEAFRSTRDPRLFYIQSRWIDEAAFETHGGMPHTVRFLKQVEPLLDQPLDATRTRPLQ
jgi:quinol monooxygenase YgiN